MRVLAWLLLFLMPSSAFASEKSFYTLSINYGSRLEQDVEVLPIGHFKWSKVADKKKKVADGNFWLMAGGLTVSTAYDVETTFHGIKYSPGFHERTSGMKPFVAHGRAATYAVQVTTNVGMMYMTYQFKKSKHQHIKKLWWIMPTLLTVGHTYYGTRNLGIAH